MVCSKPCVRDSASDVRLPRNADVGAGAIAARLDIERRSAFHPKRTFTFGLWRHTPSPRNRRLSARSNPSRSSNTVVSDTFQQSIIAKLGHMGRLSATGFIPLAALCVAAQTPSARTTTPWMAGKWARVDHSEAKGPGTCPDPEFYGRNGYVTYPGGGVDRWWIEGNYLVRVVVKPSDGDRAPRKTKQRFTRPSADELVFSGRDWMQKLVRCGEVPRDWLYRPR